MATRRSFLGITTGMAVALAVTQGSKTASGQTGPEGWGQAVAPGTSLSIEVRRSNHHVAPEGIWLKAVPSGFDVEPIDLATNDGDYDPSFGKISYTWTRHKVGEVYTPEAYSIPLRVPAAMNDKHLRTGRWVHFTADEPGDWVYTCVAIDESGHMNTASVTLTTHDPEAYFTNATTIVVSNDPRETWAGAPTDVAANRVKNWDEAIARSGVIAQPVRILFKGGQSFVPSEIEVNWTFPGALFSKWGEGEAVLDGTLKLGRMRYDCDVTFQDLTHTAGYDLATDTNLGDSAVNTFDGRVEKMFVWHRVKFDGNSGAVAMLSPVSTTQGETSSYIFTECKMSNWFKCPIFCQEQRASIGISGCDMKDTPGLAMMKNNWNDAGWAVRSSGRIINVTCSDFFCYRGWFRNGAALSAQPAFRLGNDGALGLHAVLERNFCEGTFLTGSATSGVSPVVNILAERNIIVGIASNFTGMISVLSGGTFVRNNHLVMPNAQPQQHDNRLWTTRYFHGSSVILGLAAVTPSAASIAAPIRIQRNTSIYLRDLTDSGTTLTTVHINNPPVFTDMVISNNVTYGPNLADQSPVVADGPFDTFDWSSISAKLLYEGYWSEYESDLGLKDKPTHVLSYSDESPTGTIGSTSVRAIYGATSGAAGYVVERTPDAASGTVSLSQVVGAFVSGETLKAAANARVTAITESGTRLSLSDKNGPAFPVGATVVGSSSGATATVVADAGGYITVSNTVGAFTTADRIYAAGATTVATAAGASTAIPEDVTKKINIYAETGTPVAVGATITGVDSGATAKVIRRSGTVLLLQELSGTLYSLEVVSFSGGTGVINDTNESFLPCQFIPRTVTPSHEISYTGASGTFEEGETLTGGTSGATAMLTYHQSTQSKMMLWKVTGAFRNGETITGKSSGAQAKANGPSRRHGADFLYVPTGDFTGGGVVGQMQERVAWAPPGKRGAFAYN
ncbi:hypothetical protein [Rhodovulum visakhapatnamense]|uniref:Uncharacterized protein n=1 Tax=Rhodovulum visakhapatnamense TaxID=364297 RepID=A0A4R8F8R5_9RHOB|nr:hypothetical protein [Rhodovulum visakhapatnamense]TDX21876.1 hypothetical protein EV657_13514 [Rhodovulum visakhapatnamense]